MLTSYHNHTDWSDGAASLAEMLDGARAAGLDEFGLSDHYVLFPDGRRVEWAMPPAFLGEYVARMRAAISASHGLTVRLGIEADFFPETVEQTKANLAPYPFDYILGAVHFLGDFGIDSYKSDWDALSQDEVNEKWRRYWVRVAELARSGLCDVVAHLDLPKKFGYLPTVDLTPEANAALDAIAAADLVIEINTAGWYKEIAEAYPSLPLLRAARERGIPLQINADAHAPDQVARDFDRARALAREAGYTELVRFAGRGRFTYPLATA